MVVRVRVPHGLLYEKSLGSNAVRVRVPVPLQKKNKQKFGKITTFPYNSYEQKMGYGVMVSTKVFGAFSSGSSPDTPTFCGSSSIGRVLAFQAEGCEFEPRLPLNKLK